MLRHQPHAGSALFWSVFGLLLSGALWPTPTLAQVAAQDIDASGGATAPVLWLSAMLVAGIVPQGQAQALLRADPKRPTDKVAADLGVTEATFIACFYDVTPAQGFEPDAAYQRANKAIHHQ